MGYGFQNVKTDTFLTTGQRFGQSALQGTSSLNRTKEQKVEVPHTIGGALQSGVGMALAGNALGSTVGGMAAGGAAGGAVGGAAAGGGMMVGNAALMSSGTAAAGGAAGAAGAGAAAGGSSTSWSGPYAAIGAGIGAVVGILSYYLS